MRSDLDLESRCYDICLLDLKPRQVPIPGCVKGPVLMSSSVFFSFGERLFCAMGIHTCNIKRIYGCFSVLDHYLHYHCTLQYGEDVQFIFVVGFHSALRSQQFFMLRYLLHATRVAVLSL